MTLLIMVCSTFTVQSTSSYRYKSIQQTNPYASVRTLFWKFTVTSRVSFPVRPVLSYTSMTE